MCLNLHTISLKRSHGPRLRAVDLQAGRPAGRGRRYDAPSTTGSFPPESPALGAGPHPSQAVAEALGSTTPGVGALRDRLITDGVVYSPTYGQVEFALPLLDDCLRRSGP